MISFSNVKNLTTSYGDVEKITHNGKVLWEKTKTRLFIYTDYTVENNGEHTTTSDNPQIIIYDYNGACYCAFGSLTKFGGSLWIGDAFSIPHGCGIPHIHLAEGSINNYFFAINVKNTGALVPISAGQIVDLQKGNSYELWFS